MQLPAGSALDQLSKSNKTFLQLFSYGSLSIEVYKPHKQDFQTPHDRDELYVIIEGNGIFFCDGNRSPFKKGDLLFVPAATEHRFEDFTEDFSTWVVFYGPIGGEANGA